MHWVGYAELASAVSNGGGLGIVRIAAHCNPTLPESFSETRRVVVSLETYVKTVDVPYTTHTRRPT